MGERWRSGRLPPLQRVLRFGLPVARSAANDDCLSSHLLAEARQVEQRPLHESGVEVKQRPVAAPKAECRDLALPAREELSRNTAAVSASARYLACFHDSNTNSQGPYPATAAAAAPAPRPAAAHLANSRTPMPFSLAVSKYCLPQGLPLMNVLAASQDEGEGAWQSISHGRAGTGWLREANAAPCPEAHPPTHSARRICIQAQQLPRQQCR